MTFCNFFQEMFNSVTPHPHTYLSSLLLQRSILKTVSRKGTANSDNDLKLLFFGRFKYMGTDYLREQDLSSDFWLTSHVRSLINNLILFFLSLWLLKVFQLRRTHSLSPPWQCWMKRVMSSSNINNIRSS